MDESWDPWHLKYTRYDQAREDKERQPRDVVLKACRSEPQAKKTEGVSVKKDVGKAGGGKDFSDVRAEIDALSRRLRSVEIDWPIGGTQRIIFSLASLAKRMQELEENASFDRGTRQLLADLRETTETLKQEVNEVAATVQALKEGDRGTLHEEFDEWVRRYLEQGKVLTELRKKAINSDSLNQELTQKVAALSRLVVAWQDRNAKLIDELTVMKAEVSNLTAQKKVGQKATSKKEVGVENSWLDKKVSWWWILGVALVLYCVLQ